MPGTELALVHVALVALPALVATACALLTRKPCISVTSLSLSGALKNATSSMLPVQG